MLMMNCRQRFLDKDDSLLTTSMGRLEAKNQSLSRPKTAIPLKRVAYIRDDANSPSEELWTGRRSGDLIKNGSSFSNNLKYILSFTFFERFLVHPCLIDVLCLLLIAVRGGTLVFIYMVIPCFL